MSKNFMDKPKDRCHYCNEIYEDFWEHFNSCKVRLDTIKAWLEHDDNQLLF